MNKKVLFVFILLIAVLLAMPVLAVDADTTENVITESTEKNAEVTENKVAEPEADTPTKTTETGQKVLIATNVGDIIIELYPDKAPVSVENFLKYVDDGFYTDTIFHRVIRGFVIQAGGFTADMKRKNTLPPVTNEANNGLSNDRGTIAMARTGVIDSATSQFYINLKDNLPLNYRDDSNRGYGYCVFGRVISGMETVDKIAGVITVAKDNYRGVPQEDIVITKAERI
jgi:cyclophilin family peptidyl-prolyl cis-trans isomerase